MFRLSRAAEYGVRGVLYLAINYSEDKVSVIEEIAKAQDVPLPYMAKLFQTLARKGFVKSFKGQKGGFVLTRDPREINLLEVIEAMEGPIFLNVCLFHEGYCPRDKVCSVHDVWAEAQKRLVDYLRGCNFAQMAIATKKKAEANLQLFEKKGGVKK